MGEFVTTGVAGGRIVGWASKGFPKKISEKAFKVIPVEIIDAMIFYCVGFSEANYEETGTNIPWKKLSRISRRIPGKLC